MTSYVNLPYTSGSTQRFWLLLSCFLKFRKTSPRYNYLFSQSRSKVRIQGSMSAFCTTPHRLSGPRACHCRTNPVLPSVVVSWWGCVSGGGHSRPVSRVLCIATAHSHALRTGDHDHLDKVTPRRAPSQCFTANDGTGLVPLFRVNDARAWELQMGRQ